jgi:hypothetical protein
MRTLLNGKNASHLWKVNTVSLLKEMVENNDKMGIFKHPVNIFGEILGEVAERAKELNDPKLNVLMCRLALYEQADPFSPSYSQEMMDIVYSDDYIKP